MLAHSYLLDIKFILQFKAASQVLRTRMPCFTIQLTCVKYTASVHSEPGSNSL